eukprot:101451-Heterocapsa_arctica.AAC.1
MMREKIEPSSRPKMRDTASPPQPPDIRRLRRSGGSAYLLPAGATSVCFVNDLMARLPKSPFLARKDSRIFLSFASWTS